MGEACHETLVHGIADDGKDHRDRASGSLQFGNDWGTVGEDQIWRRSHQLPDVSANAVDIPSSKPIIDADIAPVDPIRCHLSQRRLWVSHHPLPSQSGCRHRTAKTPPLNRAHATWLEYALVQRAQQVKQSHLENGRKAHHSRRKCLRPTSLVAHLRSTMESSAFTRW